MREREKEKREKGETREEKRCSCFGQ